jgi:repressor LexA
MLTQLEQRILDFIRDYFDAHEHAPTLTEIGQALGIKSKGTVHRYVQSLTDKGELEHVQRGWRGIRLVSSTSHRFTTLPLVGRIAAGHPIEAIPDREELNLSEMFVGRDRYALQIKGDSMVGIGILNGDLVIIEPRDQAEYGDIVVALVDEHEATLKRFKRYADGRIELSPENPDMRPMVYEPHRVRVQGILVGQLRTYQ